MSVEDCISQDQGQVPELVYDFDDPVQVVTETELLAEVGALLAQRGAEYGPPSDHHARTAQAVNAILGTNLTPTEVALFFVVDKLVRRRTSPGKRDHYADMAGYIAIAWGHQERAR